MNNNGSIADIAKKLHVSTAMVSRVLRHCGGVDSQMRQRIFAEAEHLVRADWGECAVYTILPDVPRYFWQPLREGLSDELQASEIPFKSNIYTRVRDESIVLRYLDEAERLNAWVIILAADVTPAIHQRLESIVKKNRLIILVSEYHELINSFYVGSDSYQDGYALGEYYASHFADRSLLMFTCPGHSISEQRLEGFSDALRRSCPEMLNGAVRIKLEKQIFSDLKLLPSKLAPLLMEAAKPYEQLCIYSPLGIPQFPLAIVKAKLTNRVVCLCQDSYTNPDDTRIAVPMISCNQDNYAQGKTAAKLAVDFCRSGQYPDRKMIYVPSRLDKLF